MKNPQKLLKLANYKQKKLAYQAKKVYNIKQRKTVCKAVQLCNTVNINNEMERRKSQ